MPRFHPRPIKRESLNEQHRNGIRVFYSSLGDASVQPGLRTTALGVEHSLLKLYNYSENKYELSWQLLVRSFTALALSCGRTRNQFLWHPLRETMCILDGIDVRVGRCGFVPSG